MALHERITMTNDKLSSLAHFKKKDMLLKPLIDPRQHCVFQATNDLLLLFGWLVWGLVGWLLLLLLLLFLLVLWLLLLLLYNLTKPVLCAL